MTHSEGVALRFGKAGYGRKLTIRTLTQAKAGKEHLAFPFFHGGVRVAPLFLVLTVLTSCSTVEGARNSDLVNELVAEGHYKNVASCIARAWNSRTDSFYYLTVDEGHQKAYISAWSGGTLHVSLDETTVTQINGTEVLVEARRTPNPAGDPRWVRRSIQNCLGANPTETARIPARQERLTAGALDRWTQRFSGRFQTNA